MTQIVEDKIIWYPGIYSGREDDDPEYAQLVSSIPEARLIKLVQTRAKEDGEWAIENGYVGDNEAGMRKMMEWVSRPKNIIQCGQDNPTETVDWVCRDLANGSKWIAGGGARD